MSVLSVPQIKQTDAVNHQCTRNHRFFSVWNKF